jgi:hypothetical protein
MCPCDRPGNEQSQAESFASTRMVMAGAEGLEYARQDLAGDRATIACRSSG